MPNPVNEGMGTPHRVLSDGNCCKCAGYRGSHRKTLLEEDSRGDRVGGFKVGEDLGLVQRAFCCDKLLLKSKHLAHVLISALHDV